MRCRSLPSSLILAVVCLALCAAGCETKPPEQILWEASAHARSSDDAFTHWDEDDPAEIPADCAKCHSTAGFEDFLGADGSAAGTVDSAVPAGPTVENNVSCDACHSTEALALDSVTFPSGQQVSGLGSEAICAQCHQGRESGAAVDEAITAAGVDDDTVSAELGFLNIHYYAAAATLYGSDAGGGYEYAGQGYAGVNSHAGNSSCLDCHDPHALSVDITSCQGCHPGTVNPEDIRLSGEDFDGDGDTSEGLAAEIQGQQANLLAAMQSYADSVAGTAIAYDPDAYPYYFADANGNGTADEGEERYASWTPRLLRAGYNNHVVEKDPGGYVHNGTYLLELMEDSIADLGEAM